MFPGGTHPHEGVNGKAVNSGNAIRELPAPARVVIPLSQHIGAPCKPIVQKGDLVLAGQKIGEAGGFVSAPVHSSVSGKVVGIEPVELANGSTVSAVVIENDFQNNWVELHPAEHPETLTAQELQTIVREAGIVGMGGATFPTQVKITPPKGKTIEKLVINGAECEPYLTADHRLMLEKPAEIIDGIHLMMLALDVKEAHVGVENNKMDAVEALRAAAKNVEGITIHDLPVRYPQGGEKQLVYALTRRKVPTGGLPLDVGCVVSNVGTVYAIQQAIREGRPLVQRVTTVGGLVNNPGNFLVSVGTPIDTLLEACGGMQSGARMLISGGPMMGMAITRTDIPVTKGTSGVLVLGEEAVDPVESACINCGRCLRACPMQLMPTLLDRCVRADRYDEAEKYGIMNCIECGACTFVCPAKRLLTQSIMQEVCLALLPAGIAGVIIFGWSALMLICVSVATCVLSEFVWEKLTKQTVTIGDWSAVVTGLLLAYNLPANAPWWLAVVGGVIAIVLVKQMFGGIGSNFMNPALTARAILFVSWSALMSSYPQSNFAVDATTSATPLGLLSKGVSGVNFMDLLLGNCGGVLGETCKLAILVGGIYLCVRKIADWRIPVSFIATVFVCYLIKDGAEMAIYQVFAGGLMLGAFFMATDYATSPVTVPGRVIMGIGCGLLLFIIRAYANYPEGCSFAILFMNVCTPLIDRFTAPHPFGEVKKHG